MRQLLRAFALTAILLTVILAEVQGQPVSNGGVTVAMVEKMRGSFTLDAATRAAINAMVKNDIKDLALNREVLVTSDHFFSHKIKTGEITNQKSSGRCWLFAGLNIMRPKILEKYNLKDFDFSENYLFFWDKLEKANLFLESIIKTRKRRPKFLRMAGFIRGMRGISMTTVICLLSAENRTSCGPRKGKLFRPTLLKHD